MIVFYTLSTVVNASYPIIVRSIAIGISIIATDCGHFAVKIHNRIVRELSKGLVVGTGTCSRNKRALLSPLLLSYYYTKGLDVGLPCKLK